MAVQTDNSQYQSNKMYPMNDLVPVLEKHKQEGKIVGMLSGSWDLLHPGHVIHIQAAKKHCDILVVAVAKDEYNRRTRKSEGRPVFNENVRAFHVSSLEVVDYVIIEDDCHLYVKTLKPNVYFKGIDYKDKDIPEVHLCKEIGGKLLYTDTEKLSTTAILKYIKKKV